MAVAKAYDCKYSYCGTRMLLFQSESLLQGIQIFGIEDSRQGGTVHCALGSHRILAHITSVWHLFSQNNNL